MFYTSDLKQNLTQTHKQDQHGGPESLLEKTPAPLCLFIVTPNGPTSELPFRPQLLCRKMGSGIRTCLTSVLEMKKSSEGMIFSNESNKLPVAGMSSFCQFANQSFNKVLVHL